MTHTPPPRYSAVCLAGAQAESERKEEREGEREGDAAWHRVDRSKGESERGASDRHTEAGHASHASHASQRSQGSKEQELKELALLHRARLRERDAGISRSTVLQSFQDGQVTEADGQATDGQATEVAGIKAVDMDTEHTLLAERQHRLRWERRAREAELDVERLRAQVALLLGTQLQDNSVGDALDPRPSAAPLGGGLYPLPARPLPKSGQDPSAGNSSAMRTSPPLMSTWPPTPPTHPHPGANSVRGVRGDNGIAGRRMGAQVGGPWWDGGTPMPRVGAWSRASLRSPPLPEENGTRMQGHAVQPPLAQVHGPTSEDVGNGVRPLQNGVGLGVLAKRACQVNRASHGRRRGDTQARPHADMWAGAHADRSTGAEVLLERNSLDERKTHDENNFLGSQDGALRQDAKMHARLGLAEPTPPPSPPPPLDDDESGAGDAGKAFGSGGSHTKPHTKPSDTASDKPSDTLAKAARAENEQGLRQRQALERGVRSAGRHSDRHTGTPYAPYGDTRYTDSPRVTHLPRDIAGVERGRWGGERQREREGEGEARTATEEWLPDAEAAPNIAKGTRARGRPRESRGRPAWAAALPLSGRMVDEDEESRAGSVRPSRLTGAQSPSPLHSGGGRARGGGGSSGGTRGGELAPAPHKKQQEQEEEEERLMKALERAQTKLAAASAGRVHKVIGHFRASREPEARKVQGALLQLGVKLESDIAAVLLQRFLSGTSLPEGVRAVLQQLARPVTVSS